MYWQWRWKWWGDGNPLLKGLANRLAPAQRLGQLKFRAEIERQKRNANIKQRRDFDPVKKRQTEKGRWGKGENLNRLLYVARTKIQCSFPPCAANIIKPLGRKFFKRWSLNTKLFLSTYVRDSLFLSLSVCVCVCVCTAQISGASQVAARKATEKFLGNFYEQRTNFRVSFPCFALDIAPETAGIDFKFYSANMHTHTQHIYRCVCVCVLQFA